MSIGVSFFAPSRPASIETLLEEADKMMYREKQIKKAGRKSAS